MLRNSDSRMRGWNGKWARRYRFVEGPAGCAVSVGLATAFVVSFEGPGEGTNFLWIANGVLLAYLLTAPRWRSSAYLAAGLAGELAGSSLLIGHWWLNLLLSALNLVEVTVSASLLRRRSRDLPEFTEARYLVRFAAMAMVLGPLVAGSFYAVFARLWFHSSLLRALLTWVAADGLGTAVTAPACVAIFRQGLRSGMKTKRPWLYPSLLILSTMLAFSQVKVPVMVLVYPCLVLVLLAQGMAWAAMGALFVTLVGSSLMLRGPVTPILVEASPSFPPAVLLQMFVASAMFTLYSISIVLERQQATQRRLDEIAVLHRLVTENSRDVIIFSDLAGQRNYVSKAAQRMGGWDPDEVLELKSGDMVHPEDQLRYAAALQQLRSGGNGSLIECRVRKRDGNYLWVEAGLRVVQNPDTGAPTGILNVVRDISERKLAEQELKNAYQAIEALAVTDPLTRLANRRRFDQALTSEWRRGMRERQPLSLLLIDVDFFKAYNDTYGHLRGDSCLKQLAEAALDVVTRPGDLVARFGGEEFAIVLPNTESEGALQVAEQVCAALRCRNLAHSASPLGLVTISVGCATMVPAMGQHAPSLIQKADDALYAAKRSGRDRVCNAQEAAAEDAIQQVR